GARASATAALTGPGASCARTQVSAATGGLRPGTVVTARVACTVDLSDLVGLPGSMRITAVAHSPIDVHRSVIR
ncbi:pilus assembly protein TadE, partial [Streptomyces sp. T-3]|nr:pilus assembly protein TadE [Streptomyces sp. T-3]